MWLQVQRLLFLLADLFFMFMALIAQTSFFKGAFFFFGFQSQFWYFGGTAFNAVKARFLPSVSRSSTSTITTISMELLPT